MIKELLNGQIKIIDGVTSKELEDLEKLTNAVQLIIKLNLFILKIKKYEKQNKKFD